MGACAGKHSDVVQPALSPDPSRKSLPRNPGMESPPRSKSRKGSGLPDPVFSRDSLTGIVKIVVKGVSFSLFQLFTTL